MDLDRREFLKLSASGVGGVALATLLKPEAALAASPTRTFTLRKKIGETVSICAFCAGGCGILVGADGQQVVNIEGNPEHPINRGSLCSKAQSLYQMRTVDGKDNPRRVMKVRYRAPGSDKWEDKSWDWALDEIAKRVKQTRDASFIEKDKDGILVNRTEAVSMIGGSPHDNEECYLINKMNRALGLVYTETQARI